MKQRFFNALLIILTVALSAPSVVQAENEWVSLFNGKDLTDWHGGEMAFDPAEWQTMDKDKKAKLQKGYDESVAKHWSVKDGEIISDGNGVYLTTEKDYGNFELQLDWVLKVAFADSGIYLRGYPQVQIWDPASKKEFKNGAPKGSGALWNNKVEQNGRFPLVKADKPIGEWNTFKIKMVGDRVTVHFNDQLTVDNASLDNYFKAGKPIIKRGPIQLQTHGGEVRFRNIKIKELPDEVEKK